MKKSSTVPQLDFTLESGYLPCHRPTKVTGKMNRQVIELLRDRGIIGATAEEINQHYGWTTASAKLSELRSIHAVRKTEARRNGHTVWVLP